jgi:hypothetical protein
VLGGDGKELIVEEAHRLPDDIGLEQWPQPADRGATEFLLPREDPAVLCYLHRDGAGWTPVIGDDGKEVEISIRDTWDLAQGWSSVAPRSAGAATLLATVLACATACLFAEIVCG